MASQILLISANQCQQPDPVYPLGLAYLSSALQHAGHKVRIMDLLAHSLQTVEEELRIHPPDFIGLSLRNIDDVLIGRQTTYFENLPSLCQWLHARASVPIILGGSGFSIFPERLMELTHADYGICGEGENSFPALMAALEAHLPPDAIPGLVFWRENRLVSTAFRPVKFHGPMPERSPELAAYYVKNSGMLNIQTQRGCAWHCSYCTYPIIEGKTWRRQPPEAIACDFEQAQKLGAKYVFIVDSVFNTSPEHVSAICETLLRHNIRLQWSCFLRPQGVTPELMKLMVRAGLCHVEFGSDSFCDSVLHEYGKTLTFDDILQSDEAAHQAGIHYCHFLIAGGPGETSETLHTSFNNSQRLQGGIFLAIAGMRIYPRTTLYKRALAEEVITPTTDLLPPVYYIAPGLTIDTISATLKSFARQSPSWIVGNPPQAFENFIIRLRQRGILGPSWSYYALIQQLWPQSTPIS